MPLSPRELRDLQITRERLEKNYETTSRIADMSSGSNRRLAVELASDYRLAILQADRTLEADRAQRRENDRRAEQNRLARGATGAGFGRDERGGEFYFGQPKIEQQRREDPLAPGLVETAKSMMGRVVSEFSGEPMSWMAAMMHPKRVASLSQLKSAELQGSFNHELAQAGARRGHGL